MSKKGGKREGAGKPALYGEPMERKNVMLDQETIEFYTKIGGGNLSKGIRNHWRKLTLTAIDPALPVEDAAPNANDQSNQQSPQAETPGM